jgi:hypothetical protein
MTEASNESEQPFFSWQTIRNFVATVSIVLFWVHGSEFLQYKHTSSVVWCAGIALIYFLCIYFSSDRIATLAGTLLAVVALGVLNGIVLRHSWAALPLMIPCAVVCYLLIRWKAKQTK